MKPGRKIGFIGAGNMGDAITGALIQAEIFSPPMIYMSDISQDRLNTLRETYGIQTMNDNVRLFSECDIVILAVKPQQMAQVLSEIAGRKTYGISGRKLVVSIAAGIPIQKIEGLLYPPLDQVARKNLPIIRVMPNTPSLVLAGISGMSANQNAVPEDMEICRAILEAMGKVVEFEEGKLNAVTALSGSGPAYVFYMTEAMTEGGISAGLEPADAAELTLATLKGAVKLMEERKESPESLRRKVTSPGGTTEAALKVMKARDFKQIITEAILAAARRSEELSV